jgi:hypothetical protein
VASSSVDVLSIVALSASCFTFLSDKATQPANGPQKDPANSVAGVKWRGKRLHPSSLDQNESTFCDPPHIYTSAVLIFSRLAVEKTSKPITISVNSMIAFMMENSKLIMIFLLIGLIIALGSWPYRHETRE